MTKATIAAWLQAFLSATKPTADSPILLILDNHTSRFDVEFLEEALKNHVHVLLLPPNLTHLLQPADVGVFSSLKARINTACQEFTVAGGSIEKLTVARIAFPEWLGCVSKENILSGFRKTGIWPFNRLAVPDSKLTLEASVVAEPSQPLAVTIAQQQTELLATPQFGEFLSTPRLSEAKKDKGTGKVRQAIIVTGAGMVEMIRKKAEAKKAKAAGVLARRVAREEKKKLKGAGAKGKGKAAAKSAAASADGKDAKPAAAAAAAPKGRKRKRAASSEDEDEEGSESGDDASSSGGSDWEPEDGALGRIHYGVSSVC